VKFLVAIGTRPEAIKLAPVVAALRRQPGAAVRVCATSQHQELLHSMLKHFGIEPDFDLRLMRTGQTLAGVAREALAGLARILEGDAYDWVVCQGDTTTAFAAALAGCYARVKVAHVEAGLRSGDLLSPFPEEAHRRMIDAVATHLYAPTEQTAAALRRENVPAERIFVTGNTGIDALLETARGSNGHANGHAGRTVLLTAHRRESFEGGLDRVFGALGELVARNPGTRIVFPVHPNPQVQAAARRHFGAGNGRGGVDLVPPMDYPDFVAAMQAADLILTDSGGVQEEAPSLGTPVLVLRENTERPEAVAAGAAELVGTDPARILARAEALLRAGARRAPRHVYGDGRASDRIAEAMHTGKLAAPFVPG
jgi:UDP-N-acetylglucosamine 2-epimerase (non-hydrolysing)